MQLRLDGQRGLSQVLEDYLTRWEDRTGIAVEVWALPGREVPAPVAEAVVATVREAFDNVERHSRARTASIAVTAGARGLRLTISDDGVGFPLETEGRGLLAMKAGLARISGTLKINSVLGGGTTVSAVAPLG
ncbi:sensor histidine kinase [Nonomuraea sp. NPDC049400]|uniref:sensor histidine kinase n=1 Tax=Nonomuraea sp. NPDC049400 TaxID=3364352 RepID=UPI0037A5D27C